MSFTKFNEEAWPSGYRLGNEHSDTISNPGRD